MLAFFRPKGVVEIPVGAVAHQDGTRIKPSAEAGKTKNAGDILARHQSVMHSDRSEPCGLFAYVIKSLITTQSVAGLVGAEGAGQTTQTC